MDEKILSYRKKHPKCKYCKWLKYISVASLPMTSFYECIAKKKTINDCLPDITNIPRWFCTCYEVDETQLDNK